MDCLRYLWKIDSFSERDSLDKTVYLKKYLKKDITLTYKGAFA